MQELVELVQNVGVPSAVALWLLYEHRQIRVDRSEERGEWRDMLEEQTQEIRELRKDLTQPRTPTPARPVADGGEEQDDVEDDRE